MSCPGNAAKTHRELFSEFYRDLLKEPLEDVLAICPRPLASLQLFQRMMHDIMTGGQTSNPIDQASSSAPLLCQTQGSSSHLRGHSLRGQ